MPDKSINQQNKRLEIIYHCYEYLSINGLKNLTMNSLLKYLDISKGTFYHYFKSKDELISNLFFEITKEHIFQQKQKLKNVDTLRKKIEILYDVYLVNSYQNKIFIDLYKDFLLIYSHKDEEYINLYNRKFKDILFKALSEVIHEEIDKKKVKKDSLITINTIMAAADGMMMYSYSLEEYDLSKEFSIFLDFYIESIKI